MKLRKGLVIIVLAMMISLTLGLTAGTCQVVIPCDALPTGYTDEQFGLPIVITSAITSTSVGGIPVLPYCDVRGIIPPDIGFNVKVPVAGWNQRFYMTGWQRSTEGMTTGRGDDGGVINESGMVTALSRGFVTAGSDGGHALTLDPFFWAYNPPDNSNPDANQKKYDFYMRANHETAVLAKKIIGAYYGSGLRLQYSYFEGSSDGGRQALMEAQLYPQDFDGIIAAYPVMNCAWSNVRYVWNKQALNEAEISVNELQNIADIVYNKCDSVDGLVDGFIDDPRKCTVNPDEDFRGFTPQQIRTIQKIYQGPATAEGGQVYPGTPFGSEISDASGLRGWQQFGPILPMPAFGEVMINNGIGFLKYMAFEPPEGPAYDYRNFSLDSNLGFMANTAAWCSAEDPNLLPFKSTGGKMIVWHGFADAVNPPLATIGYYESVLATLGENETQSFFKLYMIPGAFNGGGIGCSSNIDWLSVIQQWAEGGDFEPGAIIGTRPMGGGYSFRTRPLCPYPQVARYLGAGSIDDALSFVCTRIVPSTASIKPKRINPDGRGSLKASLTVPEGYNLDDLKQVAVTCEGAPGEKVKITKKGRVVKAKFARADLKNLPRGQKVIFTVTAIFEQGGKKIAFEGSEPIHVTN